MILMSPETQVVLLLLAALAVLVVQEDQEAPEDLAVLDGLTDQAVPVDLPVR